MYLFIYVGRALHCHKNIDITDMMHSDESFPLELYKCFVSGETRKVWPEVPGVISVTSSLHLSALHWLSLSAVNMCPVLHCHNHHNLKLVTRYNLWPNYSQYQFRTPRSADVPLSALVSRHFVQNKSQKWLVIGSNPKPMNLDWGEVISRTRPKHRKVARHQKNQP